MSEKSNTVVVTSNAACCTTAARMLAEQLGLPFVEYEQATGLALCVCPEHLALIDLEPGAPGPVYVDFVDGVMGHRRRFGGGRGQLVARAVGIKKDRIPYVIDATAGLGRDAFILAQLGCRVTMLERSPMVAALLRDGLRRAEEDDEVAEVAARMSLTVTNAQDYLGQLSVEERPDVIYVDPMHPARSKTALVKKEMRLFRDLVGTDKDDALLLTVAVQTARKRVVVKRPRKAVAIAGPVPDLVYEGKSTRFDVYLITT